MKHGAVMHRKLTARHAMHIVSSAPLRQRTTMQCFLPSHVQNILYNRFCCGGA